MGCKRQGAKNRAIVIQKEKSKGSIFRVLGIYNFYTFKDSSPIYFLAIQSVIFWFFFDKNWAKIFSI